MRHSSLVLILASMIASAVCAGCSPLAFLFPEKPVYVPPGVMVELAEDATLDCWADNIETGKREKRTLRARDGWMIVRPRAQWEPTEEEKRKPIEKEENPEPSEPATAKKIAARW
jgi:hypothetical protein